MNNIKYSSVLIGFLMCAWFVLIPDSLSETKFYTKRASNELRKGPANYFPIIGIVPQNTEFMGLKEEDGWIQVQLDTRLAKLLETHLTVAWISKNCLIEKPVEQNRRQFRITTKVATPSSVAAAIRGFAIRFKRTSIRNVDALLEKDHPLFTNEEFQNFVRESNLKPTVVDNRALRKKYIHLFDEYDFSLNETMVGFNIAAEIASRGVVDNPPLHKYLNLLGTLILQRTNAYDRFFKIYILNSSEPEAFSTPGGIIFISSGLIKACTSEAELAAVIAHEMIHVILHHGLTETHERSQKIKAEEAFAELDEATGDVADSAETDLESYMQEAYDSVVKPRLQVYEEEADQGSIVFLVQAGYEPNAILNVIKRIPTLIPKRQNDLEENPFFKCDYEQRYQSAMSFINEYFPHTAGVINIDRFNKNCLLKGK